MVRPSILFFSFVIASPSTSSLWQRHCSSLSFFASRHCDQGRWRRHLPFLNKLQDHCPFCSSATFVLTPHDVFGDVANATSGVSPHPSFSLSLHLAMVDECRVWWLREIPISVQNLKIKNSQFHFVFILVACHDDLICAIATSGGALVTIRGDLHEKARGLLTVAWWFLRFMFYCRYWWICVVLVYLQVVRFTMMEGAFVMKDLSSRWSLEVDGGFIILNSRLTVSLRFMASGANMVWIGSDGRRRLSFCDGDWTQHDEHCGWGRNVGSINSHKQASLINFSQFLYFQKKQKFTQTHL